MLRRHFLHSAALSATALAPRATAGQFTGRIRKSLKWGMVTGAKGQPLEASFRRLRECGFDGVEPSLSHVTDEADWLAASRASGLVIDGTVGARTEALGDQKTSLVRNWERCRDQLREAAPLAERARIRLLVENVWATFLVSPFDLARFIDEVGSPWVQVHFDVGNLMRWGVAEHWTEVLGRRILKLDVKEYDLGRAMREGMQKGFDVPLGEGSINWPAVRAELVRIGFAGWAAAEVKGGDWTYLADVATRMDRVLDL
jgi:hexulose-6-phosphate isomerase